MAFFYTGLSTYATIFFIIIWLASDRPRARCGEFITLFFATALTCCLIGQFFPALSAAVFYAPSPDAFVTFDPRGGAYHLGHLDSLRNDPFPILSLHSLPGLVTFPSFHTAMGVVAIYCCRGIGPLFTASLVANGLMIASTPICGAHYLIDVIMGAVVAAAIILLFRRYAPAAEEASA